MTFVRIIPGDEALNNGLLYPGDTGLRLATNGSTSGLAAAGGYIEIGLSFWMASGLTRATLLDLGTVWVGFHADMAGNGPSIAVAVTDGVGNSYAARYAIDPRSTDSTYRQLEVIYIEGSGFEVFYGGVAQTAAQTAGTDSGIAGYTDSIALGCDVEGNLALDRASAVVGTDWDADSTETTTANELQGGIVWIAVGRSPGLWTLHMDMEGDFADDSFGSSLTPAWMSDTGAVFAEASPIPEPVDPPPAVSAFGFLPPGASIGGMFTQLCTVREMTGIQDSLGMGTQILGTAIVDLPCTLQPMSTANSMIYKAESAASMFDLFIPLRLEGASVELPSMVGTEYTVDGIRYRVVGEGMRQGQGGIYRVPVQKVDR